MLRCGKYIPSNSNDAHDPPTRGSATNRKEAEMAHQNDFTKALTDMIGATPFDTSAIQEAFRTNAEFGEKFSNVALDAAERSTEISSKWTQETLARMGDVATVKEEPTDYSKAMTDFASAQAESAAEHMTAFAEVAKKVQTQTVELMMAAGKAVSKDITAAADKATAASKRAAAAK